MPLTNSATCWNSKIHGSTDMFCESLAQSGRIQAGFRFGNERSTMLATLCQTLSGRHSQPPSQLCRNSAGRRLCTIYVLADVAKALTAMVLPGRRRGVNIRHELPVCRMREPALTRL